MLHTLSTDVNKARLRIAIIEMDNCIENTSNDPESMLAYEATQFWLFYSYFIEMQKILKYDDIQQYFDKYISPKKHIIEQVQEEPDNNLIFKFDFSTVGVGSTGQILHARLDTFAGAAGPAFDEIGLLTDDFDNMSLATGSATSRLMVTGYYDVVSATNTLQLRWAQHTATALGSIDVEAGSFLAVTRLGDT